MLKAEYQHRGKVPQDVIEAVQLELPPLAAGQALIKVLAAPINPSDLGLLIGPADVSKLQVSGSGDDAVVTAPVPEQFLRALTARLGDGDDMATALRLLAGLEPWEATP